MHAPLTPPLLPDLYGSLYPVPLAAPPLPPCVPLADLHERPAGGPVRALLPADAAADGHDQKGQGRGRQYIREERGDVRVCGEWGRGLDGALGICTSITDVLCYVTLYVCLFFQRREYQRPLQSKIFGRLMGTLRAQK